MFKSQLFKLLQFSFLIFLQLLFLLQFQFLGFLADLDVDALIACFCAFILLLMLICSSSSLSIPGSFILSGLTTVLSDGTPENMFLFLPILLGRWSAKNCFYLLVLKFIFSEISSLRENIGKIYFLLLNTKNLH